MNTPKDKLKFFYTQTGAWVFLLSVRVSHGFGFVVDVFYSTQHHLNRLAGYDEDPRG